MSDLDKDRPETSKFLYDLNQSTQFQVLGVNYWEQLRAVLNYKPVCDCNFTVTPISVIDVGDIGDDDGDFTDIIITPPTDNPVDLPTDIPVIDVVPAPVPSPTPVPAPVPSPAVPEIIETDEPVKANNGLYMYAKILNLKAESGEKGVQAHFHFISHYSGQILNDYPNGKSSVMEASIERITVNGEEIPLVGVYPDYRRSASNIKFTDGQTASFTYQTSVSEGRSGTTFSLKVFNSDLSFTPIEVVVDFRFNNKIKRVRQVANPVPFDFRWYIHGKSSTNRIELGVGERLTYAQVIGAIQEREDDTEHQRRLQTGQYIGDYYITGTRPYDKLPYKRGGYSESEIMDYLEQFRLDRVRWGSGTVILESARMYVSNETGDTYEVYKRPVGFELETM